MSTITQPATHRVASTDDIRSHFPAMERRHRGHFVAYLDGPGGTQVPRVVAERMTDYLFHHNANTHWRYPTSAETDALIMDARRSLAEFVNGSPDEIAFGANMTTLTFHVARSLGRAWGPDDEIVVTELDHHANVAPWRALERDRGVRVIVVRMRTEDGTVDVGDLERKLSARTRLVAIGAASNALGTINDVPRIAALARERSALVFVDAVHYAAHALPDVAAFGCDFLACSAYKFYGPHIGVLWGKRALIERLDVPKLAPAPEESPERLETGTQNHEGIVGAGAAVDYLASLARTEGLDRREALSVALDELHARGVVLFKRLWQGLGEISGVRRFGLQPGGPRTPTLAFRVDGKSCDDVAVALAERGLFVSHGDFYAATVIERLGVGPDGVVRVGCSAYTSAQEIERVIQSVAEIASQR
ncbi:MAG TPA: cysteine desulfurase-like protein [Gemmatimonadaceae bacterium]|nr:cysteine desulfurase-like protein [Gemmatimonadaceae bacterium]